MKKINITIVTYSWPPKNSIAVHRPYTWAKYWSQYENVNVTVLTTRKYDYDAPNDLLLLKLNNVKVIEVDYLKSSENILKILIDNIGISLLKKIYKLIKKRIKININPRVKWRAACSPLVDELSATTDILVSTYDPAECHLIAYDIKKRNSSIFWVADYRDLWSLSHVAELSNEERETISNLEKVTVGNYADLAMTVSQDLGKRLSEFIEKKVIIAPNGFDLDRYEVLENISRIKADDKDIIKIVYTGRIYPKFQNPLPLLEALKELDAAQELNNKKITIDYYGPQQDYFEEIKEKFKMHKYINNYGYVDRKTALKRQKDADFLLLLESPLPKAKGVLTGKIFEYISTGVPILSLGSSKDSSISEVLNFTKTGKCYEENKEDIKELIRSIVNKEELSWFNPSIDNIMVYSRKNQAEDIYKTILQYYED